MFRKLGLATVALIAMVGLALASGLWHGFPIINGASYCSSYVNANCVNTVAAGPALTGLETIPVDTHAPNGQAPQTALLSLQDIGSGIYDYEVPVTTNTITETNLMNQLIIDPAGTLAALTVVLPAATTLVDGQQWGMCTTQIISALTLTAGSGTTVKNAPTALLVPVATGAASCFRMRYVLSKTAWYRVQ